LRVCRSDGRVENEGDGGGAHRVQVLGVQRFAQRPLYTAGWSAPNALR
jgi:hypothetical protein